MKQELAVIMPIRFRCAYCNQLLGIARRKAGSVVRCPTCAGQVVVPGVEGPQPEHSGEDDKPSVFEQSDFADFFESASRTENGNGAKQAIQASGDAPVALSPVTDAPGGAWGTHAEPAFDVERILPAPAATAKQAARLLTKKQAMILAAVAGLLIILAFGAGLLVGYNISPEVSSSSTQNE